MFDISDIDRLINNLNIQLFDMLISLLKLIFSDVFMLRLRFWTSVSSKHDSFLLYFHLLIIILKAIRDLDVKSTNRSSSHSVRLRNQICDLHAKLRRRQSVQSSLTHQTSAYAENEKNIKLHNWMNTQLSKESRDVANIQWTNERHARDKRRHITEISHFINSLSILQRKSNWKMRSIEN